MEEALAKSARGDTAAFGEIVLEHQSMVFSMAYHFLQDRWRAEDLSQEVFLRLYQHLAAIESPAHLPLWLRKVTIRRCIDEVRRRPIPPSVSLEDVPEPVAATSSPDPLLSQRLRGLVASLPEKARVMIILRYQEELELAEIAETLDIPINTVKSRLQRALTTLRERLTTALEVNAHETP